MRSFDPRKVGSLECRAWETYYRRRWPAFLLASVGLVRAAFGMNWARTLVGAWLVLRANMKWAPLPDNDPSDALLSEDGRCWSGPMRPCWPPCTAEVRTVTSGFVARSGLARS